MERKLRVGILGATGMVGQRFITLLETHPWFEIGLLAASPKSAGQKYSEAVKDRWNLESNIPSHIANMPVYDSSNIGEISKKVDFVFCAVDMSKEETLALEEAYAKAEVPVISNNSAARMIADVPMLLPELNAHHVEVIPAQMKRLGTKKGFIAVKPNCSLQSYVPALFPLKDFGIKSVLACTYQAISGAGKTFSTWPEMQDNVIPFISGEEQKSELEPLKIFGSLGTSGIVNASNLKFSAQCIRVPVSDGHMAAVYVSFERKPCMAEVISRWREFSGEPQKLKLPSAPLPFLNYFDENDRPQTKLDRDFGKGMGVSMGRLREDNLFDYKFVCLSHNTVRGAAGGAVLMAELLVAKKYIVPSN
jgi:aspartate-semialdehyde dehydrogenase